MHPHLCKCGPARLRPHRALATVLAKEGERGGAHVNLEHACPQVYETHDDGRVLEAILDVVMHFPGGPSQRMIDVTVRCPHASIYNDCNLISGVAANAGVQGKLVRYRYSVLALWFETYGCLAGESIRLLRKIPSDFVRADSRAGSGVHYYRLRWSLERALLFKTADATMLSLGARACKLPFRFAAWPATWVER